MTASRSPVTAAAQSGPFTFLFLRRIAYGFAAAAFAAFALSSSSKSAVAASAASFSAARRASSFALGAFTFGGTSASPAAAAVEPSVPALSSSAGSESAVDGIEGRVVCVDVTSMGIDCAVVDIDEGRFRAVAVAGDLLRKDRAALVKCALGEKSDALVAKCETAARAVIKQALASISKEALEAPSHYLVRGEATLAEAALKAAASLAKKNVAVVEAEAVDAVLGAAFLTASELGLPRAPEISQKSVLASSIGIAPLVRGSPDTKQQETLFEAGEDLPCSARHAYVRKDLLKERQLTDDAELSWAFVEDSTALREGCYDPFETVDDDDEVTHAQKCTVEYSVDTRGIPVARVLAAAVPRNAERMKRKAEEKKCHGYLKMFLLAFVALPGSFTLYHMGKRRITRAKTIAILEDFYGRAQPDKVANGA